MNKNIHGEEQHTHACPLCGEEAVPERCRHFRFDWEEEEELEWAYSPTRPEPHRLVPCDVARSTV